MLPIIKEHTQVIILLSITTKYQKMLHWPHATEWLRNTHWRAVLWEKNEEVLHGGMKVISNSRD